MARAAVGQPARCRVEDAAEHRAADRPGDQRREPVHGAQRLGRARVLQQQGPAGAAELPHHGGGIQPMTHAVTDHDPGPPVRQFHDVKPVAADFQGAAGQLVPGREAVRQPGRAQDGPLQHQGRFPLLVALVHPVQSLAQVAAQQGQQRAVLRGERPGRVRVDRDGQQAQRVLHRDPDRLLADVGRGQQRLPPQRGHGLPERSGQVAPAGLRIGGQHLRLVVADPGHGERAAGVPEPPKLVQRALQSLRQAGGPGQQQAHGRQGLLALPGVPLGGDVPQRADHHAPPGVRVVGLVEAGRHPQPMAVPVRDRRDEAAPALPHQLAEGLGDLTVGLRIGVRLRPPDVLGRVGQVLWAVAEDVGEGRVDLDHRTVLVAQEERLVQGVDQRRTPAGVMSAQLGQFHVGPDPGQQFRGRERLDQVVVGARAQTLDRGLLASPGRQQQDRHVRRPRIGAQRGHQGQAVQAGHHHVADDQVRGVGPDRLQRGQPVRHRGDLVPDPEQSLQVLPHVGVVVGQQDPGPVAGADPVRDGRAGRRRTGGTGTGTGDGGADYGQGARPGPAVRQPAQRFGQVRVGRRGHRAGRGRLSHVSGRQVIPAERQPDRELGPRTRAALGADRAAVQADQLAHQRQPDPAALVGA